MIGRHERGGRPRHPPLLRLPLPHGRRVQAGVAAHDHDAVAGGDHPGAGHLLRRRPPDRPGLPHHADHADLQAGAPLHRPPVHRLHAEEQLQGARPPHALPGHGRPHLL